MIDILSIKDEIVKVLLCLNIISLIIGFFVSSKNFFIIVIIANIVLNGTFIVIWKKSHIFQAENGLFNETFKDLGNTLDYFHNLGRKKDGEV